MVLSVADNSLVQCYSKGGPWTKVSEAPGSFLEANISGSTTDLLNQNLWGGVTEF